MKNFVLVASLMFAVGAFCPTAQGQKGRYEGEEKKEGARPRWIDIDIIQGRSGYEVRGSYDWGNGSCRIRGTYFPKGQRLRARCLTDDGSTYPITGKLTGNSFEIEGPFGFEDPIVAKRVGDKSTDAAERPVPSHCPGTFAGTWDTNVGKLTIEFNGHEATGNYDFDGGTLRGTLISENVLSGNYKEKVAGGTFRFTLAADGQSFTGTWKRTSGSRLPLSGGWRGKCIQP